MAHEIAYSLRTQHSRMGSTQKEWHYNDTKHIIWSNPPSVEQVIADLDMTTPIQLRPIYDSDGRVIKELQESWRPHFNPDGSPVLADGVHIGQRLGLVGPSFTPVQDKDFINWFAPWVDSGLVELQSFGAIFNGRRVFGLAKIKRDPVDIQPNDPVASYLGACNGHDGWLAFRAFPTNVRMVCNNTVQAALTDKTFRKFGIKHNKYVMEKMDDLRTAVALADGMFLNQCEKFKTLAGAAISSEEEVKLYFQKVLAKPDEEEQAVEAEAPEESDSKNLVRKLIGLFESGIGNKGKSYWDAFNAFTQFSSHIRGRTVDARLDKMMTGTTAKQNVLALGYGLAAIQGLNISNMSNQQVKKIALAA